MKKIIIFIFALITTASFSQSMMSEADQLREAGKYEESIPHYLKLKKNGSWDWGNIYNYSKSLALTNKIDSCYYYLNQNIDNRVSVQVLTDKEFIGIKEDKRWDVFEKEVIKRYLPSNDVNFSAQIYRIIALTENDDKNISLFFKLIKKKGWPKRSNVGSASDYVFSRFGSKDLFLKKSAKYLKDLELLCLAKEIEGEDFTDLYDKIQIANKKPQKFGTQWYYDANNQRKYYAFLDRTNIDKWRKQMGLKPINEHAKLFEIEIPN